MMTRFVPFALCCKNWSTPSFRPAVKRAFASRSRWPAFPLSGTPGFQAPENSKFQNTKIFVMAKAAASSDDAPKITPELVRKLREKTNAGMMDCKRALEEAGGDMAKAETILRT